MSAILGRIEFSDRPVDEARFKLAMAALAHYGKDGTSMKVDGPVALGHHFKQVARRESAEMQPVSDGPVSIVADVILDNRSELCASLNIDRTKAAALPDSALILKAFLKWGAVCTEHLQGDYAFGIYNSDRRELFLARDHIGARPLYWARHGTCIVFASDLRALVAFGDLELEMNEGAVAEFLTRPDVPQSHSFFTGVTALEPGHQLVVTKTDTKPTRWWDPRQAPDVRYARQDDYVAHFRDLTEASIAARVDTNARVGCHISGGLDSTTIGVLAGRILATQGRSVHKAYAWAPPISDAYPDMGRRDERRVIAAISDRIGAQMEYGSASPEDVVSFMAEPVELDGTADLLAELPLLGKASGDGIGVMLSGWGGDEAYSAHGYGYIAQLLKSGRIGAAISVTRAILKGRRNPKMIAQLMWAHGVIPMLPDGLYNNAMGDMNIYAHRCFIAPGLAPRADHLVGPRRDIRLIADPKAYMCDLLMLGHLGERMETWAAWGAQSDLVYRYPLTDRRLVEFSLGLPPDLLFADGSGRFMARASVADCLPESTQKYDSANELLRENNRLGAWRLMAKSLKDGAFDDDCEWLNMPVFRDNIARVPETMTIDSMKLFAEISVAARMWHMFRRWT